MTLKETTLPAQGATRWWSAPARFHAATLAMLRQAARERALPVENPWLRQTPNGIRA